MQAIETKYNGILFRSRLEARWALYFDIKKIRYFYEYEGYKLDDNLLYLPDFYFPDFKHHAEVKPFSFSHEEFIKAWKLVEQTRIPIILLSGPPEVTVYPRISNEANSGWVETDENGNIIYEGNFPRLATSLEMCGAIITEYDGNFYHPLWSGYCQCPEMDETYFSKTEAFNVYKKLAGENNCSNCDHNSADFFIPTDIIKKVMNHRFW